MGPSSAQSRSRCGLKPALAMDSAFVCKHEEMLDRMAVQLAIFT